MDRQNKIKLIHCADFHLDMPFTSLGGKNELSVIRRRDLRRTFQKVITAAAENKAEILLICGDLYEHDYVKNSTLNFICEEISKLSETLVFLLPGNHDPDVPNSPYSNAFWPQNVHVLREGDCFVDLHHLGVRVHAGKEAGANIAAGMINIMMFHGTVDMPVDKNAFNPVSGELLAAVGADYVALGHFHNRFEQIDRRIYNPGSPEALGFDEEGEHGYYIVEINKEGGATSTINASFVVSGIRRYRNLELGITGLNTDEAVSLAVDKLIEESGSAEDLYKLTLTGLRETGFQPELGLVCKELENKVFFFKICDETRPDYDFELLSKDPGLKGLFVKKLLGRLLTTAEPEQKKLVKQALYYGLEAMEQGEIS